MFVNRILCVLVFVYGVKSDYAVPSLTLEALKRGGFRVYIPDVPGTALFAFHANINDNIRAQHPGSINGETKEQTNGFWILEFNDKLKVGDVINYWIFVNANHLGYRKDGEPIKINRLFDSYTALGGDRCEPSVTVINGGKTTCARNVILLDNFDGTAINTNLWKVEHKIPTYAEPNLPFNSYENRDETRFARNNKLHLKPNAVSESEVRGTLNLREGCTGVQSQECFYEQRSSFLLPPVRSSKLVSKTSFKYGKIEIRAQLPRGDWIFPIVQLEPVQKDSSNPSKIWIAYSRGNNQLSIKNPADIDIRGLSGNDIGSHLLLAGPTSEVDEPERSKQLFFKYTTKSFYDDFHTYGVLWTQDKIRFFVDSEEYGNVSLKSNPEIFNREYVLSLGVGVGGLYDFPDGTMSGNKEKPWLNKNIHLLRQFFQAKPTWLQTWDEERSCLIVDYVRVTAICHKSMQINRRTKPPPSNKDLCQKSETTVNGKRSCKGEIIFDELFDELSTSKWKKEKKFAGDPDYEFVLYQDNATNVYVKDNILHIKPTLLEDAYGEGFATNSQGIDLGATCTGVYGTDQCVQKRKAWQILPPVISAQISTMDYFSFKYGIVEISAKLPKGDWIYPDISLVSRSDLYGPGHDSGRIRIAVTRGNAEYDRYLFGGCIFGHSQIARTVGMKRIASKQPWTDDFHTYKIQWKPNSITFSVDNQDYGTVTPPSGGFAASQKLMQIDPLVAERWAKGSILAPFDHEMFLTLGVGVGGEVYPEVSEVHRPWTSGEPKAQLNFYKNKDKWYNTWNDDSELLVDYIKLSGIMADLLTGWSMVRVLLEVKTFFSPSMYEVNWVPGEKRATGAHGALQALRTGK